MTWTYTLIALSILAAGLTGYYIGCVFTTRPQEVTKEDTKEVTK